MRPELRHPRITHVRECGYLGPRDKPKHSTVSEMMMVRCAHDTVGEMSAAS
jgi:hypothetical protein